MVMSTLPYNGLSAVVSQASCADYRGMQRQDAVRYLLAHQRVTEAVMNHCRSSEESFAILPVKFGTVLADEARMLQLLAYGAATFQPALDELRNLFQIELLVLWDLNEVFQEIRNEPAIAEITASIAARPNDDTTAERIVVGQMVKALIEKRRSSIKEQFLNRLRDIAQGVIINPPMDDSMVLNLALLLDDAGHNTTDQLLDELDEQFAGKLNIRSVGPLPPYSFASVDVRTPSFAEIENARQILGLGETSTYNDIRKVYHQLAGTVHPDHHPDNPESADRMTELAQAYDLLMTYAASQRSQTESPEHVPMHCDFRQSAVEQTLLISIQRQEH